MKERSLGDILNDTFVIYGKGFKGFLLIAFKRLDKCRKGLKLLMTLSSKVLSDLEPPLKGL